MGTPYRPEMPLRSRTLRCAMLAGLSLACLGASGDGCVPSGSVDGGYVGPGAPSLEVTVDGVHVGPAPTTAGAYADLVTQRNELGQVVSSNLTIHAVAQNASCDLGMARFGAGIQPFRSGVYRLRTPLGDTTPDGSCAAVSPPTMVAGNLTLKCFGTGCDSAVFALQVLDSAHVEGYLSGQLADPNDGQVSNAVCSFYVPFRTYQP